MKVRLTIGTAVYNLDEQLLRAHIEHVMRQLTDETELLLIDDCSKNNSGEVCAEYAAADPRVRYIRMEQNGGLSVVRNRTIEEAKGQWIFFVDGDDLLSDYAVETALKFCDDDSDIIIHDRLTFVGEKPDDLHCGVRELTVLPEGAGRELSISCLCLDPGTNRKLNLSPLAFYHAAWGALYRKEFLEKNNLRFPAGQKKAQDAVFNTQAYYCAGKISYLPYVMYYYRNNPGGITRRYSADMPAISSSLLGHLEACMEKYYPGDEDVRKRYLQHRVMSSVIDNMRLDFFHKDNPKPAEVVRSEFLAFIYTEPYRSAIRSFSAKESGRTEWALLAALIRKRRFTVLRSFVGSDKAYNLCCGAYKRLLKIFG